MRMTMRGTSDISTLLASTGIDLNPMHSPVFQTYVQPRLNEFAASTDGQALIQNFTNNPAVHDQLSMAALQAFLTDYWPWLLVGASGLYLIGRTK